MVLRICPTYLENWKLIIDYQLIHWEKYKRYGFVPLFEFTTKSGVEAELFRVMMPFSVATENDLLMMRID